MRERKTYCCKCKQPVYVRIIDGVRFIFDLSEIENVHEIRVNETLGSQNPSRVLSQHVCRIVYVIDSVIHSQYKERAKQMATVRFNVSEFESKIRNLESNGFEEYLSTHNCGIDHVIMTNTKSGHFYNGWVADIYSDGRIEYSSQFKTNQPVPAI